MMSKHGSYMLALSSLTSELKCDMCVSLNGGTPKTTQKDHVYNI